MSIVWPKIHPKELMRLGNSGAVNRVLPENRLFTKMVVGENSGDHFVLDVNPVTGRHVTDDISNDEPVATIYKVNNLDGIAEEGLLIGAYQVQVRVAAVNFTKRAGVDKIICQLQQ